MGKKERRNNLILLTILFAIIALVLFLVDVNLNKDKGRIIYKVEIPIHIELGNVTGLKVDNQSLDFGRIAHGSSAGKRIKFNNSYSFPVSLNFEVTGEVKDFITVESVCLLPGEVREVGVSTIVFDNQSFGNYTGILVTIFKVAEECNNA